MSPDTSWHFNSSLIGEGARLFAFHAAAAACLVSLIWVLNFIFPFSAWLSHIALLQWMSGKFPLLLLIHSASRIFLSFSALSLSLTNPLPRAVWERTRNGLYSKWACQIISSFHPLLSLRPTRRVLSQFWSFKIRRSTFLNYIKFADPRILRKKCERACRVLLTLSICCLHYFLESELYFFK